MASFQATISIDAARNGFVVVTGTGRITRESLELPSRANASGAPLALLRRIAHPAPDTRR
jgi:hypothetical protein